jgi:hypothetical protein
MLQDRTIGDLTLDDVETTIALQAWLDMEFRRRLLTDPKGTIEAATGQRLPEDMSITVHEETSHQRHLVIPAVPVLEP